MWEAWVGAQQQTAVTPAVFQNTMFFFFLRFPISFLKEDRMRQSIKALTLCHLTSVSRKAGANKQMVAWGALLPHLLLVLDNCVLPSRLGLWKNILDLIQCQPVNSYGITRIGHGGAQLNLSTCRGRRTRRSRSSLSELKDSLDYIRTCLKKKNKFFQCPGQNMDPSSSHQHEYGCCSDLHIPHIHFSYFNIFH